MGIAAAADDFITHHAVGALGFLLYGTFVDRCPVARPAGTGVVLCLRAEERVSTGSALVHAFFFIVQQGSCERSFGPLLPGDAIHIG